jgi:hypothetical protein
MSSLFVLDISGVFGDNRRSFSVEEELRLAQTERRDLAAARCRTRALRRRCRTVPRVHLPLI